MTCFSCKSQIGNRVVVVQSRYYCKPCAEDAIDLMLTPTNQAKVDKALQYGYFKTWSEENSGRYRLAEDRLD